MTKQDKSKVDKALKTLKKEVSYAVICGCDLPDGTRYEIGDKYDSTDHPKEDTTALIEMNAIVEK